MKPRIRLIGGIYYCATYCAETKTWHSPKGLGFTPRDAWEEWRKLA